MLSRPGNREAMAAPFIPTGRGRLAYTDPLLGKGTARFIEAPGGQARDLHYVATRVAVTSGLVPITSKAVWFSTTAPSTTVSATPAGIATVS